MSADSFTPWHFSRRSGDGGRALKRRRWAAHGTARTAPSHAPLERSRIPCGADCVAAYGANGEKGVQDVSGMTSLRDDMLRQGVGMEVAGVLRMVVVSGWVLLGGSDVEALLVLAETLEERRIR